VMNFVFSFDPILAGISHHALAESGGVGLIFGRLSIGRSHHSHQSLAVRKDRKTQRMRAVQVKAFARFGQLELDRS
jgi:hypothetical protein